MNKNLIIFALITLAFSKISLGQNSADPWKPEQLLSPAVLDSVIKSGANIEPLIICVGPSALIKGSVDAGPAKEKGNLDKLRQLLSNEKRDREIVIYCGCCPFDRCPNIRPAFQLLHEMKFTHPMLLNLAKNLKTDWIDHGYSIHP
ncbi:MAG TPA: rhodanese-like domain-containing protein [Agriterribacter sp.]|nr:rhodanese-like domain-containing protein [Agriterribacter sp.]